MSIACEAFYHLLAKRDISFFCGVPDSLLKDICAYITDHAEKQDNIITANEGAAIGLAAGYHLATGKICVVYMQNSGEGNAVNPLTSLVDHDVYSIPLILLIGWRGEPGVKDEPQHVKQGKITLSLLNTLGIPYEVLPDLIEEAEKSVEKAISISKEKSSPYALVVKAGTFEEYNLKKSTKTDFELNREGALKLIVNQLGKRDIIVSTTGKTSRELFEYRKEIRENHNRDFLTVGSMGHSSSIALGISLQRPDLAVYCFDGDGAAIMHMGTIAVIAQQAPKNLKHIIFNNGAHDSVGGQPTAGFDVDFTLIAKGAGYPTVLRAETSKEVKKQMQNIKKSDGPALLEIRVNKGARKNLGRPTTTTIENKKAFMEFLQS